MLKTVTLTKTILNMAKKRRVERPPDSRGEANQDPTEIQTTFTDKKGTRISRRSAWSETVLKNV